MRGALFAVNTERFFAKKQKTLLLNHIMANQPVQTSLAALPPTYANVLGCVNRMPLEDRFFWLNTLIEQIDPGRCIWSEGDLECAAIETVVAKLNGRLESLFQGLTDVEQTRVARFIYEELVEEELGSNTDASDQLSEEQMLTFDTSQAIPLFSELDKIDQT